MLRTGYGVILIGLLAFVSGCGQSTEFPERDVYLTRSELGWIGEQVFRNECAGRHDCLVHWNEGEAFPSLGIGHFIWYPEGADGPFVESFPAMIDYLIDHDAVLPSWLGSLDTFDAPWANREAFLSAAGDVHVRELKSFLAATKDLQAGFLIERAEKGLGRVLEAAPEPERAGLSQKIDALISTPGGTYAVIDYLNFKGEGLAVSERYKGQGWGLLQVLQGMGRGWEGAALQAFSQSAAAILTRRAINSERVIEKDRWLPGWLNRLKTYREPE